MVVCEIHRKKRKGIDTLLFERNKSSCSMKTRMLKMSKEMGRNIMSRNINGQKYKWTEI